MTRQARIDRLIANGFTPDESQRITSANSGIIPAAIIFTITPLTAAGLIYMIAYL